MSFALQINIERDTATPLLQRLAFIALGEGVGGYDDSLGNAYPPFAFNSGMWTFDVGYDEAVDLGVLEEGAAVPDMAEVEDFGAGISAGVAKLAGWLTDAVLTALGVGYSVLDGVLSQ